MTDNTKLPCGGRGNRAPWETTHYRIPTPLKYLVTRICETWKASIVNDDPASFSLFLNGVKWATYSKSLEVTPTAPPPTDLIERLESSLTDLIESLETIESSSPEITKAHITKEEALALIKKMKSGKKMNNNQMIEKLLTAIYGEEVLL